MVNVADLLAVIVDWGNCPSPPDANGCAGDLAPAPRGNGTTDVNDLLEVIQHWGE